MDNYKDYGGIDPNFMKAKVQAGSKKIYGSDRQMYYFDLRKDECWNAEERCNWAEFRILQKPGTAGFAYVLVHKGVGRPGRQERPRMYVCGNQSPYTDAATATTPAGVLGPDIYGNPKPLSEVCAICDAHQGMAESLSYYKDRRIQYPVRQRDGRIVTEATSIFDIIEPTKLSPLMILVGIEPMFYGNSEYLNARQADGTPDPKYVGLASIQVYYIHQGGLIGKISKLIQSKPGWYFTHPEVGYSLYLTYHKDAHPQQMYNVQEYRQFPIDPILAESAPDPAGCVSSLKPISEQRQRILEMAPGEFEFD